MNKEIEKLEKYLRWQFFACGVVVGLFLAVAIISVLKMLSS